VEKYTLATTGSQRVFESANIPTAPRGTAQFYDGGDRLYVVGGVVTVTRATWIQARGVGNQATAWEIYPVKPQLTTYVNPFGENLTFTDFARTYVLIQATEDNTTLQLDLDGNGTFDNFCTNNTYPRGVCTPGNQVILNRGQSFLLDRYAVSNQGAPLNIVRTGTVIRGSSTLQVKYIAGNPAQTYRARGFSAFPRGYWTTDYYAPLDQPNPAGPNGARNSDYYLYNPNSAPITVNWESRTGSNSFTIPAGATVSFRAQPGAVLPVDSGLYFRSTSVFWGVGVGDALQDLYEWGFSLLPSTMMYTEHFLGWAPDCNPSNPELNCTDMGVFLTVAQDNTRVFVDTNGDGTPDQTYTLDRLQTVYITAPNDGDLSNTHFWATGPFTMAYGQDAATARTPGPPGGMDLGYVSIPGTDFVSLVLTVDKSVSPQVVPTASGSSATFTIKVNTQQYTLDGVTVTDFLPPNWDYDTTAVPPDTTTITRPDMTTLSGSGANPTKSGTAPYTLSWTSAQLGTDGTPGMVENQEVTITFTARTTTALTTGTLSQNRVSATGTRTVGVPSVTQTFTATDFAYVVSQAGTATVQISKASSVGATTPVYPGDTITYTTTITNPAGSGSALTGVTLFDALPAGVSMVAGTTRLSRSSVADSFNAVANNNQQGTRNWSTNWVENNDNANVATGRILINTAGALQLHQSGFTARACYIYRQVDLSAATSATLAYSYSTSGADAADRADVDIYTAATGWVQLRRYTGAVAPGSEAIDISGYLSNATQIRFSLPAGADYAAANDYFYVDWVSITYNVIDAIGGNPPDMVPSSNGYTLLAGQSLTATFNVTVDDPLASGITSITNTAATTSRELPIQVTASATNIVTNPTVQSGTAGDRVWLDTNGNGVQDIGEPGIANVEVTLKDQWGTPVATTVTDGTGRYLFTGVAAATCTPAIPPGVAGCYYVEVTASTLPSGLTQSYPGGYTNNRSAPFNLADGQTYIDADLGYRASATTATFGDLVWVDANNNGLRDSGEVGLGGIIVGLYVDADADGILDPAEMAAPLRTTTTAADGSYLFTGVDLTTYSDYIVAIDPTYGTNATRLSGYAATTATYRSYLGVGGGSAFLNADFGFQGTTVTTYSIQDRVWFDADGDGVADAGENGIPGVTVELLDASLRVIGTTTTAADGTFTFSGVAGGGADYTTRISDTTGVLADYYGTTPHATARQRAVSNVAGIVDWRSSPGSPVPSDGIAPSYGFSVSRAIGDTIYFDVNGNGSQDTGDNGIAGLVVYLYRDDGDGVFDAGDTAVGSVTTDANGQYLFAGLTNAFYFVSVPPITNYTFRGPGTDSDGNPANGIQKGATISGTGNVLTVDFGFQPNVARSLEGYVYYDANSNGTLEGGESGIAGVTVDVLLGTTVVATLTTDSSGYYSLAGLTPASYTVRVTDTGGGLTGYSATSPTGTDLTANLAGGNATGLNFGFARPQPTYAAVAYLKAYASEGSVVVEWRTTLEVGTVGFHVLRLDPETRTYARLNENLLPALVGQRQGGTYRFQDVGAPTQGSLVYKLVERDFRGRLREYGPYTVSVGEAPIEPLVGHARRLEGAKFQREAARPSAARRAKLETLLSERFAASRLRRAWRGKVLKLTTRETGLHYLPASQIATTFGVSQQVVVNLTRARALALSHRGRPVPYLPDTLDAGLYFHAEPVGSVYTTENVYWLAIGAGSVMGVAPSRPSPIVAESFPESVHREIDQNPLLIYFQDPESDFWAWEFLYAGYDGLDLASTTIRATDVAGTGPASLQVHLVGGSAAHHVEVLFNGVSIGEIAWNGIGPHSAELPLSASDILEGDNTIQVKALLDPGMPESIVFTESFDLHYERRYRAANDLLAFSAPSGSTVEVTGFSSPSVIVLDVTRPAHPAVVMGTSITRAGDGTYTVRFGALGGAESGRYLAQVTSRAQAPVDVVAWKSADLRSPRNRADYVLIAPDSLADAARSLADYRNGTGLSTMVVDLEAIYDEFNGGIADPHAIREFLRYATTRWAQRPTHATLVGRGTFDFKNVTGYGDNLVPPLLAGTPDGLVASDVRLADLSGDDGVPEIAFGRLPVVTAQELLDYVAKTQAHEGAAPDGWQRRILMVADDPDQGGAFTADSESVATLVPADYSISRVYLPTASVPAATQAILDGINDGVALFNYIGHGGLDRLAAESLLTNTHVASMSNSGRLPLFLAMTCSVGDFAIPGYPSLGEAMLLRKDGGAYAVWAPSGLSLNSFAVQLDKGFFRAAFAGDQNDMGGAVESSLRELIDADATPYKYMYNLLGEPVSRLPN
jgi:uncharacterized repeat protein (TIGR01451 family)